jgi:superfamily II DNA/RNA helicase
MFVFDSFCPKEVQTLLFSATFKPEVMQFAHRVVPNPNILTLKREELSIDAIQQFYVRCRDRKHKLAILSDIYGLLTIGQSIIFVHVRDPCFF